MEVDGQIARELPRCYSYIERQSSDAENCSDLAIRRLWITRTLKLLAPCMALAVCLPPFSAALADATSDKVKERGEIVAGVILSGPPYGFIDPKTHEQGGFNVDLSREIARRLGVKLTTVQVTPPNRVQFLQQGKVDFLIANMELTTERAEILGYAPTPFFRIGGAAVIRKDAAVKTWADLKGKRVCVAQGSAFTKPLAEEFGAEVKGYPSQPESLLALKGGNCIAAVHISGTVRSLLKDRAGEWTDFEIPIADDLIPSDGVVWVRKGDKDIQAAIDGILRDLHGSGWMIETARKNGVLIDAYLTGARDRYGKNRTMTDSILVLPVKRAHVFGLNFGFLTDGYERGIWIGGLAVTLELVAVTIPASLAAGVLLVGALTSPRLWLAVPARIFVELTRNTPTLVQLYCAFLVVNMLISQAVGGAERNPLGPFFWVVAVLSLHIAAFHAESLRAGIESVPLTTLEAALSLGFSRLEILREIELPLALRVALPSLSNNLVNLVKLTTLGSAVAVGEIVYASGTIWTQHDNVVELMMLILALFGSINLVLTLIGRRLEARLRIPGHGI
jgi:polar amino acid transport system substrate-binding protein